MASKANKDGDGICGNRKLEQRRSHCGRKLASRVERKLLEAATDLYGFFWRSLVWAIE